MKKSKVYELNTTVFHLTISVNWTAVRVYLLTLFTLLLLALFLPQYRLTLFGLCGFTLFAGVSYCLIPSDKVHRKEPTKSKKRISSKRQVSSVEKDTIEIEGGPDMQMVKAPGQQSGAPPKSDELTDYSEAMDSLGSLEDLL